MNCPDCSAPVEYSGRGVLVDREGSGMRRHFCPAPEPEREVWDVCACGGYYVRFGAGPRLDMRTREPHVCAVVPTPPAPPSAAPVGSAEPARPAAKLRLL